MGVDEKCCRTCYHWRKFDDATGQGLCTISQASAADSITHDHEGDECTGWIDHPKSVNEG